MVKIKFKKSNPNAVGPSFSIETLHQRLKRDNAIDLNDNYSIRELECGYVQILPIDDKKIYR